jgi:hypothetical protein
MRAFNVDSQSFSVVKVPYFSVGIRKLQKFNLEIYDESFVIPTLKYGTLTTLKD